MRVGKVYVRMGTVGEREEQHLCPNSINSTVRSQHAVFFCDKGIWNKEAILETERNLFCGLHALVNPGFHYFLFCSPRPPPPLPIILIYPKMK